MITPKIKPRIFVDMDGTIAEWRKLNLELTTQEESDPNAVAKKLHQILTTNGYYRTLGVYEGLVSAIKRLIESDEYDVYIASCHLEDTKDCSPITEKNEWLDEVLPEIGKSHRIFIPNGEDKTRYVPGGIGPMDFLLDDYTKNLNDWEAAGGTGIKVLNGINSTKGTWKGSRISNDVSGRPLAMEIMKIVALTKANLELSKDFVQQEPER